MWPEGRTLAMFHEWFDLESSGMVEDIYEDETIEYRWGDTGLPGHSSPPTIEPWWHAGPIVWGCLKGGGRSRRPASG